MNDIHMEFDELLTMKALQFKADISGRAEFITFSLDGRASLNPLTWWPALRPDRAWTSLRPPISAGDATP